MPVGQNPYQGITELKYHMIELKNVGKTTKLYCPYNRVYSLDHIVLSANFGPYGYEP